MAAESSPSQQSVSVLVCRGCGKRWKGPAPTSAAACPACGGELAPAGASSPDRAASQATPSEAPRQDAPRQGARSPAEEEPATVAIAVESSGPTAAWFLFDAADQQHGPMSEAALQARRREGSVFQGDLLFRTGWADWRPAEEVFPELPCREEEGAPGVVSPEPVAPGRSASLADLPGWPDLRRSYARLKSWLQIGVGCGLTLSTVMLAAGVIQLTSAGGDQDRRLVGAAAAVAGVIGMGAAIPVVSWLRRLQWLYRNPTTRQWNDAVVAAAAAAAAGAVAAAAWLILAAAVFVARRHGFGG